MLQCKAPSNRKTKTGNEERDIKKNTDEIRKSRAAIR